MTIKIRTQTRRFLFGLAHAFFDGGMGAMLMSTIAPNEINFQHSKMLFLAGALLGGISMWKYLASVKYEDLFTDVA